MRLILDEYFEVKHEQTGSSSFATCEIEYAMPVLEDSGLYCEDDRQTYGYEKRPQLCAWASTFVSYIF